MVIKMYLSKSKYCSGIQCNKKLWLDENNKEVASLLNNQSTLENGTKVGELARNIFGEYILIDFNNDLSRMIEDTNKVINDNKIVNICEASFSYNNNFCSVDILRKDNNEYEIYEVKSSTDVTDIYIDDISYQYYVLKKCGLNVNKCSIVYINNKYERIGSLELNKLFNIEDVTEEVKNRFNKVENKINELNKLDKNEPNIDIGEYCFDPYDCPYFEYCTKSLEKPNVFDIAGMNYKKKIKYYYDNKYKFKDLINEDLKDNYLQQIDFELNNKDEYIDIESIKGFLNNLTYPLYFLDFESFQEAIPKFDNSKPYSQIPFQYSLHYIENKNGEVKHKEFLADGINDPRRNLAESLVNDIPENVCVMAYNMTFEKTRIKELANLYEDLSEHLMNIYNNMVDLMIPFKNRKYYKKDMEGSYSIKYVLPSLFPDDPSLNYHNLEMVHNGVEASTTYLDLIKYEGEELEEVRKNMLKYCGLDTFAMVKVYEKLNEKVLEKK